ncbi:MAG: DNA mismatch repair endonuclease MutL [Clostridia bacterium]|nr:DNA mismatch repair endonuclease MutL [Clostridia bacterium]
MPIRILDAATVGRIAAGEVVERPSSVVKELIENSLDAGATSITVEVKGGGIDYLRVTDNGCGIEPGQVRLAFENHATSKLQTAEQLTDIRTLGFRGEALPSIAAVSRVEMTTRAKGQESGMKLTIEGGQNMNVREAGCPQGTTIIMRDLFFNVPVRRAFLKKASYEGGLVSDAVAKLLLGNPGVSMRFISGGNTMFHSFGDGKLRHAVFAVYGREAAEKMVEIDASEGGTRIHGLIGVGELAKATRSHQLFFINGRSVRCPLFTKALEQVCRSRVTIGMYPMCVLNLVIPPTGVDVNVHPNKLEVRFRDEDMMRTACESLLARAFENERVLEIKKLTEEKAVVARKTEIREIPLPKAVEVPKQEPVKAEAEPEPAKPEIKTEAPKPAPKPEQTKIEFRPAAAVLRETPAAMPEDRPVKTVQLPHAARPEAAKPAALPKTPEKPVEPPKPIEEPKPEAQKPEIPPFKVIGVAFKTYILVEVGDTLLLIDQHAAHERLQYERYMARAEAGVASQQLLAPIIVSLSAREMAVIMDNLDTLADAGYTVEPFGENDIQVRAVPFVMGKAELKPLFLEMIQSLGQLKAATVDARRSEIMQLACKTAVKAGDSLTESEIASLISAMLETGAPPTCPHGRPVAKTLTKRDLEKMFKRIQ